MYCRYCGKEIDDRTVFCPHCGVPVDEAVPHPPKPQQPQQEQKENNAVAIAGFALSIAGALFGLLNLIASGDLFGFSILLAIPGLVCSIIGLVRAKKSGKYKAFALAGLIVSAIFLAVSIFLALFSVIAVFGFFFWFLLLLAG